MVTDGSRDAADALDVLLVVNGKAGRPDARQLATIGGG
jgi:hypothetical protein